MKRSIPFFVLAVLAAIVCACSGGGSSGSPGLPGTKTPSVAQASIKLFVPNGSNTSASKRPAYIAPGTVSFSISVSTVNGATPSPVPSPFTFALSNTSICTPGSGGTTCSVSVNVPVASAVVLLLVSYDANGNVLGQSLIGPIDTAVTPIPTQSIALGGVASTLVLNPASLTAPDDGSTHTLTFTVAAKDADGNLLVQPASYAAPITLSVTGDGSSAVTVSPTSIPSPGSGADGATTVTLTYNSSVVIGGPLQINATAGGTTIGSLTFAPTANVGGSATIPVVSIQEYALPSPPAYNGHVFGAIASEPGSSTLVLDDTSDSQIIAVPIGVCSATTHTCPIGGSSFSTTSEGTQPATIAFDTLGDIIISDPGSGGAPLGDVQILNNCSSVGANCQAALQNGLNNMGPIVTPAPHDAIAGPDGYLYTTIADPDYPGVAVEPIAEAVNVTIARRRSRGRAVVRHRTNSRSERIVPCGSPTRWPDKSGASPARHFRAR